MQQSNWLILFIGPVNQLSRMITFCNRYGIFNYANVFWSPWLFSLSLPQNWKTTQSSAMFTTSVPDETSAPKAEMPLLIKFNTTEVLRETIKHQRMLIIIFKLKRWNDPHDNSYHGETFNNQNTVPWKIFADVLRWVNLLSRQNGAYKTSCSSLAVLARKSENFNHSEPGEVTEEKFV